MVRPQSMFVLLVRKIISDLQLHPNSLWAVPLKSTGDLYYTEALKDRSRVWTSPHWVWSQRLFLHIKPSGDSVGARHHACAVMYLIPWYLNAILAWDTGVHTQPQAEKKVLTSSRGLQTSFPWLNLVMSGASHSSTSTAAGFSFWVSKNMITKAL